MSKVASRKAKVSLVFSSGLIMMQETKLGVIRLFRLMHALTAYCGWPISDPTPATDANTTDVQKSPLRVPMPALDTEHHPVNDVIAVVSGSMTARRLYP